MILLAKRRSGHERCFLSRLGVCEKGVLVCMLLPERSLHPPYKSCSQLSFFFSSPCAVAVTLFLSYFIYCVIPSAYKAFVYMTPSSVSVSP